MDLKQLEYFVAVAEERHFTRAAQRLNVVQSGLSQAIRGLEDELGGRLFVRTTRSVALTPAGQVLLDEAYRVLASARQARLAVSQVHGLNRGRLRVGSIQSVAPFVDLPASLGRFHHDFHGIDIDLRFDDAAPLLEELREGVFDVVFSQPGEPIPGIQTRLLACEGMVVACSPEHRLAGARELSLDELARETFIELKADWGMRRLVDASFAQAGLGRRIGFEVNDVATLIELAAQGLGVALLPESIARARREDRRLRPMALAELREPEEPCWEIVVGHKAAQGQAPDRITAAFLERLVLPLPLPA